MKFNILTDRLNLRELQISDAPFIFELLNSEGWLKYIGDRKINTLLDAENYIINGPAKSYKDNRFGLWLVYEKTEKKSIGICGLLKREYLDYLDIGFAFLPNYQKKGYAYEAAEATCYFAENNLNSNKLMAIVQRDNLQSAKLLKKLGFEFLEKKDINNEELDVYLKTKI